MGWLQEQENLVDQALAYAPDVMLRYALDGTVGDTQAFCWGALRQYQRLDEQDFGSAQQSGLYHVDLHLLLIAAQETVAHVEVVERLLARIGSPKRLPPQHELRNRLLQARNLLAEHRDERVLYWRLTRRHTPHVRAKYAQLGVTLPAPPHDSIDSQTLPFPGTVGGLLSLNDLGMAFTQLETELEALASTYRGQGEAPAASGGG